MSRKHNYTMKTATLLTSTGQHALDVRLADNFFSRFKGLMLAQPIQDHQAMLLTRCPSVHTAFMRFVIDVIYLDASGNVLKCVSRLKPWRASLSSSGKKTDGTPHVRAAHVLEMAAGSIERLAIRQGDRLLHPIFETTPAPKQSANPSRGMTRQQGSAMIEFAVVGPIIIALGLGVLQYGMMFFAKNQMNHAAFMAARAGSTGNANRDIFTNAYAKALIPMYGGGNNSGELVAALGKANADIAANARIELLNPTKESFDDWNDTYLQNTIGGGRRVIPNGSLASKDPNDIRANSGQNIQDANLIKLRITHGYEPKVPLIGSIYKKYLQWMDNGADPFHTRLVNAGRVPVVTSVTLQMQSDAIEGQNASSPGIGNNGNPVNPGDPPATSTSPPSCATIGCTVETPPYQSPQPPACNPATAPNQCRPPLCRQSDKTCDPGCETLYCCGV